MFFLHSRQTKPFSFITTILHRDSTLKFQYLFICLLQCYNADSRDIEQDTFEEADEQLFAYIGEDVDEAEDGESVVFGDSASYHKATWIHLSHKIANDKLLREDWIRRVKWAEAQEFVVRDTTSQTRHLLTNIKY